MIDCSDLLREYSDYKDGLMEGSRARSVRAHLDECSSCARYDAVVGRGVEEFRSLPPLEPSADFLRRLEFRLYEDRDTPWSRPDSSVTSAGLVVLLVLLIGVASWIPAMRVDRATLELPPVVAIAPSPPASVHTLFRTGPLLSPSPRPSYAYSSNPLFSRYTAVGSFTTYRPTPLVTSR